MYEERENWKRMKKREHSVPRVKMKTGKERLREERNSVTERRSQDTRLENKVSTLSSSSFFFLSISLSSNFSPLLLKSDVHHSRVPQTIYLECQRHGNR